MKSVFSKSYLLAAVAMLGLSAAAQALPTVSLISDTGTWRVTTYNSSNAITGTGTSPLTNPYGVPPLALTVTGPAAGPFSVNFTPTADFLAYASNSGGPNGKSVVMDGKIDFYITLEAPGKLTTNIYEDGVYSLTGNGTFGVSGGAVVTAVDPTTNAALEVKSNSFAPEFRNGSGGWQLNDLLLGGASFSTNYTKYKISIDNTLLAEALSSGSPGSAYVAKKDFTVIFTLNGTNGGGPQIPEPASLGVLALGGLALLARRRRA